MRSFFVLSVLFAASTALAAPPDVEVFGGASLWLSALNTVYDASYTPSRVAGINQLFASPDTRSHAIQHLILQGRPGLGLGLGLSVYPHSAVGFQFLFDRASVDIEGENPPQEVDLTYDTIDFPQPTPVTRQVHYTLDAPDTEGALDETAFSFNASVRFGAGRPVGGSVSGGLSYYRIHGEAESLAALAAWLGGHAVVFSENYEMSYALADTDVIGFNLGGAIDVALGPRAAFFADVRIFVAPKTDVAVDLEEFVSDNVVTVPLETVEEYLSLPPMNIDPGYFRVLFGVKWKP
jgi:hypothetical protein